MFRSAVQFLVLILGLSAFAVSPQAAEPSSHPQGLLSEAWFHVTSGDLKKDLAAAKAEGKYLAVFWEQPGCQYCKKMHEVNLRDAETVKLIREHFYVVLLNTRGDRDITDFDGQVWSEADLSHAHQINGTPNVEFRDADGVEVFLMPGYADNPLFKGVFEYVATGSYQDAPLMAWFKARYGDGAHGG